MSAAGIVLDYYAVQNRATLQCFKDSGVSGIAHYLTTSMSDPREINRQELEDSHAVGLAVHLFYEMNPTYPAYFTFAQGAEDCRQAQNRLADLGAPDGTVVYFTVDTNLEPTRVVEYFNGVESAKTPRITPGLYGYQRMCEFAYANFPNIGKRLAQTYGTPTVPLDLWQHLQERRCGTEVDVNDCTADGWRKETDVAETAQETYDRIAPIIQDKVVAPQANTNTYFGAVLAELTAHQLNPDNLAAGILARVTQNLAKILSGATPPVPPSCPPGTTYFGENADGSAVGWTYPDGKTHYFVNGVER